MTDGKTTQAMAYARAAYELALEQWQKTLQGMQDKLAADPALLARLNDTQTAFETRQKQLDELLPPDVTAPVRNFFYTLLKEGHLNLVDDIAANLSRMVAGGPGIEFATVTTAIELTDAEKEAFRAKLAARYGEGLSVDFVVDKSILGGVVVQVGDKILDGSVATKLNTAREKLMVG